MAWVRAENEKTIGVLQSDPRYQHFYEQALSILKDRMADIPLEGRGLERFWQDKQIKSRPFIGLTRSGAPVNSSNQSEPPAARRSSSDAQLAGLNSGRLFRVGLPIS
ncbi:hypothetical protein [Bradyrhizobium sp. Ghvi]|uniref:hypothetical protein n=1 Tax=Bradyrhizobium sp. Ghvi TaxID=1855319 RepID=UPI0015A548A8|nr:hypothetical protein [Bradyrhizobium sp. Ghvi]